MPDDLVFWMCIAFLTFVFGLALYAIHRRIEYDIYMVEQKEL